jgi:hypothetical protein
MYAYNNLQVLFINALTHWGPHPPVSGPIGPPLFERPGAQKVMKLKKFGKITYSTEIVLALKLSSCVSSKKAILYEYRYPNSWLFRPNLKFGGQNIAAVM